MSDPDARLRDLHAALGSTAATVATAESLTGGRVAAALTETPGASSTFLGGVVAYATSAKISLLGVPEHVVREHGAVSAECAAAMAAGARGRFGATWGVATTGVAGPDEQDGRPAGTVFVAVAGPSVSDVRRLELAGDRRAITAGAVSGALDALTDAVAGSRVRGREATGLG